jgi:hypothetical protein
LSGRAHDRCSVDTGHETRHGLDSSRGPSPGKCGVSCCALPRPCGCPLQPAHIGTAAAALTFSSHRYLVSKQNHSTSTILLLPLELQAITELQALHVAANKLETNAGFRVFVALILPFPIHGRFIPYRVCLYSCHYMLPKTVPGVVHRCSADDRQM